MRSLVLCLLALLAACSNPHNTPFPKDLASIDSIKPAIEKLTPEEKELVGAYIARHTNGSTFGAAFGVKAGPIPDGMTIGKAIEEQKALVAKQKAEEAAKKAALAKAEAEHKALAAQMAQVIGVRLTDLSLRKPAFPLMDVHSQIDLTFEFENKGAKNITGIKGMATFRDKFGDIVLTLPLKMEQEIPAGKRVTVRLAQDFNQFDDDDRKLANLNPSSVTFELAAELVLFADGSKFEAPKAAKD